jgi:hypothetical protein
MVVVVIVSVVVMVIMVVGHRVANGRAANSAHHGTDRTANNSSANGACDPSGYRAAFVSQRHRRIGANERRSRGAKHPSSHENLHWIEIADAFRPIRCLPPTNRLEAKKVPWRFSA